MTHGPDLGCGSSSKGTWYQEDSKQSSVTQARKKLGFNSKVRQKGRNSAKLRQRKGKNPFTSFPFALTDLKPGHIPEQVKRGPQILYPV